MSRWHGLRKEAGFTLIELMVGLLLISVGVAGTAAMMNGANDHTSRNKGREGATNLARSIVEIARGVTYRNLTGTAVEQAVAARPGMADSDTSTAGLQVQSRNFTYTVSVTSCSMDDPKDQLGNHTSAVTYCANTQALDPPDGNSTAVAKDRNPDDYKRVRVNLTWRAVTGRYESVNETTVITNPIGGLGPSVTSLKMTSPLSNSITGTETTLSSFKATTDAPAASVIWSINGDRQGSATGDATGTSWTFNWPLLKADGSLAVYDGTYVVRAYAYDAEGRSGYPGNLTINVNRLPPLAPTRVEGGRNGNGSNVDVEWAANPEQDVIGYRVYRGGVAGLLGTRACPPVGASQSYISTTNCVDQTAPATSLLSPALYYTVVALDKAPDGSLREGLPSLSLLIVEGNRVPSAPATVSACTGGSPGCTDVNGQPAPSGTTAITWSASTDPDLLDSIYFYRVYRDGSAYTDRYDRLYPVSGKPLVFIDSNPAGQQHTYRITAVDKRFGESVKSAAVTR